MKFAPKQDGPYKIIRSISAPRYSGMSYFKSRVLQKPVRLRVVSLANYITTIF